MDKKQYNRLQSENSLYLSQHKHHPVHWWPYGPEALLKAKEENKPIFLSIGYSSCHWCHVMANESFDDPQTANLLNEHFICIKVDREEYPDIDDYYQRVCQLFTNSGGWPLNAFLLPDSRAFFVGTYFPKLSYQGHSTFEDVINELIRAYRDEYEKVEDNAVQIQEKLTQAPSSDDKIDYSGEFPHPMSILDALENFKDKVNGGYGVAPKFPIFSFFEWSLEQALEGIIEKKHLDHIIKSVEKMISGGFYDQLRGGVHRYSTDEKWQIPHFEKMLYDQSGLLKVLSKLSMIYPSPIVYDAIIQTLEFIDNELLSDAGYFFSSQDSDSEQVEGLYYCFTKEEFIQAISNSKDEQLIKNLENLKAWFGVSEKGNYANFLNVLYLNIDKHKEIYEPQNWTLIRKAKKILLDERSQRIPPQTDNKAIASWNFLMLTALCDVIQYTKLDVIKKYATTILNKSLEGVFKTFLKTNNILHITHCTSKENNYPYLEDYVFFAEMNLRVYEISGNNQFLNNSLESYKYICKEFLEINQLTTRGLSANENASILNLPYKIPDQGFKSAVSTFLIFSQRLALVLSDKDINEEVKKLRETIRTQALKNPLSCGEALRAMTYPLEVYRVIRVPKKWIEDVKFLFFMAHIPMRFILKYDESGQTGWQVCTLNECLLKGDSLDEFINTMSPKSSQ